MFNYTDVIKKDDENRLKNNFETIKLNKNIIEGIKSFIKNNNFNDNEKINYEILKNYYNNEIIKYNSDNLNLLKIIKERFLKFKKNKNKIKIDPNINKNHYYNLHFEISKNINIFLDKLTNEIQDILKFENKNLYDNNYKKDKIIDYKSIS